MKNLNKVIKHISLFLLALTILLPTSFTQAYAAEYEIVFKAGAHGTFNQTGETSVTHKVQAGQIFPNEPQINVEAGYIFAGWNKALPEAGSSVNGKQVYVAQYDVEINGVGYLVKYQDEDGIIIATSKSAMGELGSTITERAKVIPGYTFIQSQQDLLLKDSGNEIVFTYILTNPNEREVIVEEIINVVVPGTGGAQTTTPQTPTQQTPTEDIGDTDTPLAPNPGGDVDIEDNETPLANNPNKGISNIAIGSAVVAALVIALWFILAKKKKQRDAQ